jgi:UDP-2,3-diacylglucosamine hydrolase
MAINNPLYTYFASDFHLGLPIGDVRERELRIVRFLDEIKKSAHTLYLLGDIFDFWWEYKTVVPRGFVRFLGKLAELSDSGVRICYFTGNHDVWVGDYLQQECGVEVFRTERTVEIGGKIFFAAHGDCVGERAAGKRLFEWMFNNRVLQWIFSVLPPRWGMGLGHLWSQHSRLAKGISVPWTGASEALYRFAAQEAVAYKADYFVFGHRHTPIQMTLPTGAELFVLSDWIQGSTYAVFDGKSLVLKQFE